LQSDYIAMKYIVNIVKRFLQKDLPKPVGRWRIENCNSQLNRKIELSNEDHCGPCGEYALAKNDLKKSEYLSIRDVK